MPDLPLASYSITSYYTFEKSHSHTLYNDHAECHARASTRTAKHLPRANLSRANLLLRCYPRMMSSSSPSGPNRTRMSDLPVIPSRLEDIFAGVMPRLFTCVRANVRNELDPVTTTFCSHTYLPSRWTACIVHLLYGYIFLLMFGLRVQCTHWGETVSHNECIPIFLKCFWISVRDSIR